MNNKGSNSTQTPVLDQRREVLPKSVLAVASLGAFMAFLDATIVNVAFPDIEKSFPNTALNDLSWVLNAYNIVFAALLIAAGRLADLIGRRKTFEIGITIFTVASLLCAVAGSTGFLVAARVLQAVGAAIIVPTSLALVLRAFPSDKQAHAIGLWGSTAALAAGLGPPLGGSLVELSDWRLVFLVNLPVGIFALIASRRKLVESRVVGHRKVPDIVGVLALAAAVALLALGIVKGQTWGWGGGRVIGSFVLAVAFLGVLIHRVRSHSSPAVEPELFHSRSATVANILSLVAGVGFYSYLLCHVLFLTTVWKYSELEAGFAMMPAAFITAAVAGVTGRFADRYDRRFFFIPGGLIWAGALWWYVKQAGFQPELWSAWIPGQLIAGVGVGLTLPIISGISVSVAPGGKYATAAALNSAARQLGGVIGISVLIAIIGTPLTPDAALAAFHHGWTFAAICFLVVGCGGIFVGKVHAKSEDIQETDTITEGIELHKRHADSELLGKILARHEDKRPHAGGLFAALTPQMREKLTDRATKHPVAAGEWLFRAGQTGDCLFVVEKGRLEVVDEENGSTIRLLGSGALIGELAVLAGTQRSASIRARRDSHLLQLSVSQVDEILQTDSEIARELLRVLSLQLQEQRLPQADSSQTPKTIALVGLDDMVPLEEITDEIRGFLQQAAVLEKVKDEQRWVGLLDECEQDNNFVLLACRANLDDEWFRFCLRQADRIVTLTAGHDRAHSLNEVAELVHSDLVFYQQNSASIQVDTSNLHTLGVSLQPHTTHVIREKDRADDIARLARRISGQATGLVLSGGGAKAFAHLGALAELEEQGVSIDRVAGCGMGAYIGAQYAAGLEVKQIDARCYEEWVRQTPMSDYRLPRKSLLRGLRLRRALERTFGDLQIEWLPLEFLCVSCDLRSGKLVVHRTGSVVDAVLASMAVPGLIEPVASGDKLLVDGALLDNLPVAALSEVDTGPIIAVDVASRRDQNSRNTGTPLLHETLSHALHARSTNSVAEAHQLADLLIMPEDRGVAATEYHQIDVARDAGRAAAKAVLAEVDLQAQGYRSER